MKKTFYSLFILMIAVIMTLSGCTQMIKPAADADKAIVSSSTDPIKDSNPTPLQSSSVKPSKPEETIYLTGSMDRTPHLKTLEELDANSENIFTGEVISSEPFFYAKFLHTMSCIKVDKVYKGGFHNGDKIYVGELGGRTTYGILSKYDNLELKAYEKTESDIPDNRAVIYGYEGYFPMKSGQKILLFVNKADINQAEISDKDFTQPSYYVVGGSDGKFFQRDTGLYVKPLTAKTDEITDAMFANGGALTITAEQLELLK